MTIFAIVGECRQQHHAGRLFGFHLIDHALLRVHQGRQLGQQHAAHGAQIALSLQHAGEARQVGLQPILLGVAVRREAQVVDHRVDVVFQLGDFAAGFDLNRASQIAFGDGRRDFCDGADLVRQVVGKQVDVAGEILPRTSSAGHVGLTAETSFHADFASHRRHLIGKCRQRVGHVVDGFGQRRDFALGVHGQLLREIAVGDGGHDLDDAAHLLGEVRSHDVDVVGEIFPRAGDSGHLRLSTELAVRTDFAGHARHFGGERVELVHHRVDGVLEFENFALHVDRDLARQVAASHGRRHLGDVSDLGRQVSGHGVHRVREIFPGTGDAGHVGLSAEPAFGTDFASHARHFGGERAQLLDHRVQRLFELQNFAAHVDGDLA